MKLRLVFVSALTVGLGAAPWSVFAAPAGHALEIHKIGVTSMQGPARQYSGQELKPRAMKEVERNFYKLGSGSLGSARRPAAHVPTPDSLPVQNAPGHLSFDGLTVRQQGIASGFIVAPPDQGLAVGNGFVVEGVNLAVAVYDAESGVRLTPAIGLNDFFDVPATAFTSDPKVYYDKPTNRFFATILVESSDRIGTLIAVSQTGDPTGDWNIHFVSAVDADLPGCPCFGDQPLIGADANGFFISTNEFPLAGGFFTGVQVTALDKKALAEGAPTVNAQQFNLTNYTSGFLSGAPPFSVQPAITPPNGEYELANNGTEYFLSSVDYFGLVDRIAVFAATNTASLSSEPDVHLQRVVIPSESYGEPAAMEQPEIPVSEYTSELPLAAALREGTSRLAAEPTNAHEQLVASNDDRMNQVVYTNGTLWSGVNTVVKPKGHVQTGIAWFAVTPGFDNGALTAAMANQGYIAVDKNSVVFPSIGVNARGEAIVSYTLIGRDHLPAAAYSRISIEDGAGPVQILAPGANANDGFTGYPWPGNNSRVSRWGDYSAAVADENGDIWLATEFVPDEPRLDLANWGTRISKVSP
ncbi:MAG TPA: hypothetical protein VFL45_02255 [Gammaproteobacteria bacterium]|nr:hypothetical protein [Gammaproteobacteria bacterium]